MVNFNHIVHLKRKPNLRSYRSFAKKYPKLEPHLVNLKLGYKKQFKVVQLTFIIPDETTQRITKRFTRFYNPVERYFDVIIVPTRYIGEYLNPLRSFKILGEETQCRMAGRFLNDLFWVYFGAIEKKLEHNKKSRKQSRRLRRRWKIEGELKDARHSTSRFKQRLFKYLYSPLLDSLDELEAGNPKAFKRGLLRTKRIRDYFYKKYGRSWRKKV